MKTGLTLTKIFTLIFLMSCSAAENDDKFILTGRIENIGEIKNIQVYEGEVASHTIELESNGDLNLKEAHLRRPYTPCWWGSGLLC